MAALDAWLAVSIVLETLNVIGTDLSADSRQTVRESDLRRSLQF